MAAGMMGINVYRQKIKVFVISSAITSYGGALYAFIVMFIEPNLFDWLESAKLIVITFVGGLNSLTGVVITSLIYYTFGEFFRFIDVWRDVPPRSAHHDLRRAAFDWGSPAAWREACC
jgi:branched-chain amino acid transport system permease protein